MEVLNRFIGNYVENMDSKQLKIGIWGGRCKEKYRASSIVIFYCASQEMLY